MKLLLSLLTLITGLSVQIQAAPLSGAIFTTTRDGTAVNANHYQNREDVYLNGGPQNDNFAGLPDGDYYFQVTDPNGGTLLSTDLAVNRQLTVVNGRVYGVPTGLAAPHNVGLFNPSNRSLPVQLFPFNETPNEGGVYKVWLIKKASVTPDGVNLRAVANGNGPEGLSNEDCKTDNFMVRKSNAPLATYTVAGTVFFDANYNGTMNPDEPGLESVAVTLISSSGTVVASTTTGSNGGYSFGNVLAGSYTVAVTNLTPGLSPTTMVEHDVAVSTSDVVAPVTGFAINFGALNGMPANGFTIGYWKTNLSKAVTGTTKGVQVSAATLIDYTAKVSTYALSPFVGLTMPSAVDTLSATGSSASVLLAKQLLGSEYNYANQAYLGGSQTLTFLFIYQGEYVLKNAANYSSAYLLWMKDWFDAYNNTHGAAIVGPASF